MTNLILNIGEIVPMEEWPEIPSNMGQMVPNNGQNVTTNTNPHQVTSK